MLQMIKLQLKILFNHCIKMLSVYGYFTALKQIIFWQQKVGYKYVHECEICQNRFSQLG